MKERFAMSIVFEFPFPAGYDTKEFFYNEEIPAAVLEDIKAKWGRDPLPKGGGFNLTVRLPGDPTASEKVQNRAALYADQCLRKAGVLSARAASLGVLVEGGATFPMLSCEPTMLTKPDGSYFE
ncbi:MAG: hypothetical protein AB9872_00300 [Solidesulfovibrio sp.]